MNIEAEEKTQTKEITDKEMAKASTKIAKKIKTAPVVEHKVIAEKEVAKAQKKIETKVAQVKEINIAKMAKGQAVANMTSDAVVKVTKADKVNDDAQKKADRKQALANEDAKRAQRKADIKSRTEDDRMSAKGRQSLSIKVPVQNVT